MRGESGHGLCPCRGWGSRAVGLLGQPPGLPHPQGASCPQTGAQGPVPPANLLQHVTGRGVDPQGAGQAAGWGGDAAEGPGGQRWGLEPAGWGFWGAGLARQSLHLGTFSDPRPPARPCRDPLRHAALPAFLLQAEPLEHSSSAVSSLHPPKPHPAPSARGHGAGRGGRVRGVRVVHRAPLQACGLGGGAALGEPWV